MTSITALRPDWQAPPGVRAAFTRRACGVSIGAYASLNLGGHVGDDALAVAENRRRVAAALGLPAEPLWLLQVHGTTVLQADGHAGGEPDAAAPRGAAPPRADAAITRQPGRVLAVLVADCLPVLLARRDGRAVAVAHAGWRGLAAGVVEATVAALGGAADELMAWLGPAIGPAHFEVGDEVRTAFCEREAQAALAFVRNARGRWQCDLHQLARQRLTALGLRSIHGEPRCTYDEAESFYSYRRDGITGRMAGLIWLDERSQ
jgi:YfiH family protein